jgi:hypothetical protein
MVVIIISCNFPSQKYKSQVETAKHLIALMRASDTQAVKKMMPEELAMVGKNDHMLGFEIWRISDKIKYKKIENVNSFVFKEYPRRSPELLTIYIPLFEKEAGGKDEEYLEVFFFKFTQEGRIHNFRILDADQFREDSKQ